MSSQLQILAGTVVDDATVGTVSWANPNNAKVSDNVYATVVLSAQSPHYLKATNFGFSIPTGVTINGLLAEVKGNSSSWYVYGHAVKGNVIKTPQFAIKTLDAGYTSFGSSTNLWGQTWTPEDINAIDFGIALEEPSNITATFNVDHIRITVYYTEAEYTADYSALSALLVIPAIVATFAITANFSPLSVVATIPSTTASYVYPALSAYTPLSLVVTNPNTTASFINEKIATYTPVSLLATIPNFTAPFLLGNVNATYISPSLIITVLPRTAIAIGYLPFKNTSTYTSTNKNTSSSGVYPPEHPATYTSPTKH